MESARDKTAEARLERDATDERNDDRPNISVVVLMLLCNPPASISL